MKSPDYKYLIAQCDVPVAQHSQLESYRAKRRRWLTWLDADEHPAIWTNLSSMVWTDVSYRILRQLVIGQEDRNETGCLHNTLIAEQIIQGYVARQVLGIRWLLDKTEPPRRGPRLLGCAEPRAGRLCHWRGRGVDRPRESSRSLSR